jgi:hypothetical protein
MAKFKRSIVTTSIGILAAGALLAVSRIASAKASAPPPPSQPAAKTRVGELEGDVEHGRYLAEHVAMCVECHSGRDAAGTIIDTRRYLGAPIPFAPPWPNDWAVRAPRNRGLPGYDDAQALRLLTEGAIDRNGAQLRAPMPRFRMTRQDAADVIAFLRSLK